jgi:hypothetical protein
LHRHPPQVGGDALPRLDSLQSTQQFILHRQGGRQYLPLHIPGLLKHGNATKHPPRSLRRQLTVLLAYPTCRRYSNVRFGCQFKPVKKGNASVPPTYCLTYFMAPGCAVLASNKSAG